MDFLSLTLAPAAIFGDEFDASLIIRRDEVVDRERFAISQDEGSESPQGLGPRRQIRLILAPSIQRRQFRRLQSDANQCAGFCRSGFLSFHVITILTRPDFMIT
jgi:hypothetical protein